MVNGWGKDRQKNGEIIVFYYFIRRRRGQEGLFSKDTTNLIESLSIKLIKCVTLHFIVSVKK